MIWLRGACLAAAAVGTAGLASAAMVPHLHNNESITWEADGNRGTSVPVHHPNDPAKVRNNPNPQAGNSAHQHYDRGAFVVGTPATAAPNHNIYQVWVNRTLYNLDRTLGPVAPYPFVPHGYIDESDPNNIPRYRFVGAEWTTNAQARTALPLVVSAFDTYSALQAGANVNGVPLTTGLAFTRVEPDAAAEIDIRWGGTDSIGFTGGRPGEGGVVGRVTVYFNSDRTWFFGPAADTPITQYHFFSTALHEVGHVVGLDDLNDRTDVMIGSRRPGPNGARTGPAFDGLTDRARKGALALYSIPSVPEPAGLALLGLGAAGLVGYRWRRDRKAEAALAA